MTIESGVTSEARPQSLKQKPQGKLRKRVAGVVRVVGALGIAASTGIGDIQPPDKGVGPLEEDKPKATLTLETIPNPFKDKIRIAPRFSHPPATEQAQSHVEAQEVLNPAEVTVFIDVDPSMDNQEIIRRTLGNLLSDPADLGSNPLELLQNGSDRVIATLATQEMLNQLGNHGEQMLKAYRIALDELDYDSQAPKLLPLQEMFSNPSVSRDELGNPTLSIEVDEQKIGDALEEFFERNPEVKVSNLSFQIGRFEVRLILREVADLPKTLIYYDELTGQDMICIQQFEGSVKYVVQEGKVVPHGEIDGEVKPLELLTREEYESVNEENKRATILEYQETGHSESVQNLEWMRYKVVEAYNEQFAEENLRRLIDLCNRFPDKLFSTSGGNENSNFTEVRKKLEDEGIWPQNLIISAEKRERVDAEGVDFYLMAPHSSRGYLLGSSETAVRVSVLASIIASENPDLTPAQIREQIFSYCNPTTYISEDGTEKQGYLLHPDLYKPELSAR